MSIEYTKNLAEVVDAATIDDADKFWEWLQQHPKAKVDLAACNYLHTVILQLLIAAKAEITVWPADEKLTSILQSAISVQGE